MPVPLGLKRRLITVHRWVSLAMLLFWLSQAGSGAALIFHWELNDALIETSAAAMPAEAAALGAAIEALPAAAGEGWIFSSLWASGGTPGRFDINIENAGTDRSETIRVTGNGTVLRRLQDGMWIDEIVNFHHNFLAGEMGSTIVGVSGLLLASNIILGVLLAWPGMTGLRRALAPAPAATAPARTFGRHRALGLIVAVPALLFVSCGVLMVFEDSVRGFLGGEPPALTAPAGPGTMKPAEILGVALARFPDAALAAFLPPDEDTPYYVVRLRQPGELRRAFGKTTLEISGSGDILRVYEPGQGPWTRTLADNFYPLHTGEAGGLFGRLVAMATGLGLLTVIWFGLRLWWLRRR
ncbi:MAG: PepSY domain-containing protein [Rhodospirillaceae bacterium]|nr:PepSY domain-containing protein [Rhodospirillaceae bacterium]